MPTFSYYSKLDHTKEAIAKVSAESVDAAYDYFSTSKRLNLNEFKRLFKVVSNDRS